MKVLQTTLGIIAYIALFILTAAVITYLLPSPKKEAFKETKTHRVVSNLDSNVKYIVDVKTDLIDLYKTGDTVWVSTNSFNPSLCDNCTWSNDSADSNGFIKAIIRD